MVMIMDIEQIRARWIDVLDVLEGENRVTWIAFFDARLARLDGSTLILDFSDSGKFATGHDYGETRRRLYPALQAAMRTVFEVDLTVDELP
jgi:hypothetical protein